MPKRILVAIDFDEHITRAWRLGVLLQHEREAEVVVVHAVPDGSDLSEEELDGVVAGLVRASPQRGLGVAGVVVRVGRPAVETILELVNRMRIDLLVCGGAGETTRAVHEQSTVPIWTVGSGSRRERGRARSSLEEAQSLRQRRRPSA